MTTESSLRADIVEVGRRMYARGYTASNDGNISVRLEGNRLLMTPKSVCKGFMTPDMMCITDLDGRKLQGDRDPSSEMLMHLEVYRQRPDVQAVVHALAVFVLAKNDHVLGGLILLGSLHHGLLVVSDDDRA
jgi:L-fuculose-phosphate aldolase